MISPVIVAVRPAGVSARCVHPGCGDPHVLYAGGDVRVAERRADAHLKKVMRAAKRGKP